MGANIIRYECLECGDLVPDGHCTYGVGRRLRLAGVSCEFTRNHHVRARWFHLVTEEKRRPKSLGRQQAVLAANQYIELLEAGIQGQVANTFDDETYENYQEEADGKTSTSPLGV